MSTLSLRLPDSLHQQVKALAKKDGVSINQFVSSAVAEKMTALLTEEYLQARQQQGNEQAFLASISKVADAEPADYDKLK
ncbi:YlcI/YnfO family protein [Alkalimonas delamerensis]|uniref:YlcI/YnfO family protein n=1 Tax=Alkalimonas delamerensis TaxID=265981 RepID=A0ABT9GQB8_9GAMM|nr:YlcI/YnfO family protein [Alkalimonas delamerensis]MDP4529172.1 YlcI/YnfO family protein [Alkalimonas delamerensis]